MTSGRFSGCIGNVPTLLRSVLAILIIMFSGCAPFQKAWGPRFGANQLAPLPEHPHLPESASGPGIPDSYASRVQLDPPSGDPAWVPIPDGEAGAPPAGSVHGSENPLPESPSPLATQPEPAARPPATIAPIANRLPVDSSNPEPASEPIQEPLDELDAIDHLMDLGITQLAGVRNYRVTLDRQERVRDSLQPAEQVTLSVRTEPFAVRLEWPDGPNRGREVLYSEVECNGMMHVKLGKTLIPVPPMQLEPNSPLALSNSRHPITEAGLLHILTQTKDQVELARAGDPTIGVFEMTGPQVPDGSDVSCVEVLRTTPEGEFWRLVVEEATSLPRLLEATSPDGQLLERYHFQHLQTNLEDLESSDAFDPAVRFGRTLSLPVDRLATALPESSE